MTMVVAQAASFPVDGSFWDWVGYLIMEYKGVFLKGAGWTLALAVTGTIIDVSSDLSLVSFKPLNWKQIAIMQSVVW